MFYLTLIIALLLIITTIVRRPQTRVFWQQKVTPLIEKGVQSLRRESDRLIRNPKSKRRMYLILSLVALIILGLIFR